MEKCARGRDFKDDTIEREMMYSDCTYSGGGEWKSI